MQPPSNFIEDEEDFLLRFKRSEIPEQEWRHVSHITAAYHFLRDLPFEEAMGRMRHLILALNETHGRQMAFHETLTEVWMRLIFSTLKTHGDRDNARRFFQRHSYFLDKRLPLLYYSYDRIMSREAREKFLEPDLAPLPMPVTAPAEYEADPAYRPIPPDHQDPAAP